MPAKRSTRASKSTRTVRVDKGEEAVRKEMRRRPRRHKATETSSPEVEPAESKPPARRTRRTKASSKKASSPDTRVVILAMSPGTANCLRTIMGRARYQDEPELDAIKKELEDQLQEMRA